MAKAAAAAKSQNQFDERRETIVVEKKTTWPKDSKLVEAERIRIAGALHKAPKDAKILEYIRCPTGFVRHITVTQEDLDRVK